MGENLSQSTFTFDSGHLSFQVTVSPRATQERQTAGAASSTLSDDTSSSSPNPATLSKNGEGSSNKLNVTATSAIPLDKICRSESADCSTHPLKSLPEICSNLMAKPTHATASPHAEHGEDEATAYGQTFELQTDDGITNVCDKYLGAYLASVPAYEQQFYKKTVPLNKEKGGGVQLGITDKQVDAAGTSLPSAAASPHQEDAMKDTLQRTDDNATRINISGPTQSLAQVNTPGPQLTRTHEMQCTSNASSSDGIPRGLDAHGQILHPEVQKDDSAMTMDRVDKELPSSSITASPVHSDTCADSAPIQSTPAASSSKTNIEHPQDARERLLQQIQSNMDAGNPENLSDDFIAYLKGMTLYEEIMPKSDMEQVDEDDEKTLVKIQMLVEELIVMGGGLFPARY